VDIASNGVALLSDGYYFNFAMSVVTPAFGFGASKPYE